MDLSQELLDLIPKDLYKKLKTKNETEGFSETEFYELLGSNKRFLLRAFEDRIIIPDFKSFKDSIADN